MIPGSVIGFVISHFPPGMVPKLLTRGARELQRISWRLTRVSVAWEREHGSAMGKDEVRSPKAVQRVELVAREKHERVASEVVTSVKKVLGAQEWHAGDMVWIAHLDRVEAAVIASVAADKLTLAMGSTRFAYERGFSPKGSVAVPQQE